MAHKRNRKKMSLYEVIGRGWSKSGYDKALGQLGTEESDKDEPISADSITAQAFEKVAKWPKRPRMVQFNAGRIEVSIPYPIAITLLLGIVLLILLAFRLGQIAYLDKQKVPDSAADIRKVDQSNPAGGARAGAPQTTVAAAKILLDVPTRAKEAEPINPKADNVIVLVEYEARADLVPVRDHFAKHGIETEIVRENDRYFLVTKNKYENPRRPGTDGYEIKQRITQVGAKYKAPLGYETFAAHLFSDAYGKKIK